MRGPERKAKMWRVNPAEGNDKEEGGEEGCPGDPSESQSELGRTDVGCVARTRGGGGDGGGDEEEDKEEMYEMMEYP